MPELPAIPTVSALSPHFGARPVDAERVFWTFRADDRLYGIDVSALREVSTNTAITPVPHAPPEVRGLMNLRSRVVVVLDLRPLLGLMAAELTSESRMIVLKSKVTEDFGILVDRGGDIVRVMHDRIESAERSTEIARGGQLSLIAGVCKLEHELMMIVDANRLTTMMAEVMK